MSNGIICEFIFISNKMNDNALLHKRKVPFKLDRDGLVAASRYTINSIRVTGMISTYGIYP
jgi:hypothetical protein